MTKKTATILEIAKKAGVTDATVSRALRNSPLVREGTRERVWQAARDLNYRKNTAGRGLATGKTFTIGLIIPSLRHPLNAYAAECIQQALGDKNFGVLLTSLDNHDELTVSRMRLFTEHCVDGIILMPTMSNKDISCIEILRQYKIPFVVSADVPGYGVSFASFDNYEGIRNLTRHLFDCGYRRPALLTIWPSHGAVPHMVQGFQDTLKENGLDLESCPIVYQQEFDLEAIQAAVRQIQDDPRKPDSLIVTDTQIAVQTYLILKGMGVEIGKKFGLASGDDTSWYDKGFLSITSLRYPVPHIMKTLVDILHRQIEDPKAPRETQYFKPQLIVQDSTAKG